MSIPLLALSNNLYLVYTADYSLDITSSVLADEYMYSTCRTVVIASTSYQLENHSRSDYGWVRTICEGVRSEMQLWPKGRSGRSKTIGLVPDCVVAGIVYYLIYRYSY